MFSAGGGKCKWTMIAGDVSCKDIIVYVVAVESLSRIPITKSPVISDG